MTPMSPPFPPGGPRSDLDLAEAAWLTIWRTLWLDLPLAWAGEVDRLLFRWTAAPSPSGALGDGPDRGLRAGVEPPAGRLSPVDIAAPVRTVALGLGCGDYADEVLG